MLVVIQFFCLSALYAGNSSSALVFPDDSRLDGLSAITKPLIEADSSELISQSSLAVLYQKLIEFLLRSEKPDLTADELHKLNLVVNELKKKNLIDSVHSQFPMESVSPRAWAQAFRLQQQTAVSPAVPLLGLDHDSANQVLDYVGDPKSVTRAERVSTEWNRAIRKWAYPFGMSEVEMEMKDSEFDVLTPVQKSKFQDHYYLANRLALKALPHDIGWDFLSQTKRIKKLTPGSLPARLARGLKNKDSDSSEFDEAFESYLSLARSGNIYARETLLWLSFDESIKLPHEKWVVETKHSSTSRLMHPFYPRAYHYAHYVNLQALLSSELPLQEELKAFQIRAFKLGYGRLWEKTRFLESLANPREEEEWLTAWHDKALTATDRTSWLLQKAKLLMIQNKSDEAISLLEKAHRSEGYVGSLVHSDLFKYLQISDPEKASQLEPPMPNPIDSTPNSDLEEIGNDFEPLESEGPVGETTIVESEDEEQEDLVLEAMRKERKNSVDDFMIADYLTGLNRNIEALALYENHETDLYVSPHIVKYCEVLFKLKKEKKAFRVLDAFLSSSHVRASVAVSLCDLLASLESVQDQSSLRSVIQIAGAKALSDGGFFQKEKLARGYFKAGMINQAYEVYGQARNDGNSNFTQTDMKNWIKACLERKEPEKAFCFMNKYGNLGNSDQSMDSESIHLVIDVQTQLGHNELAQEHAADAFKRFERIAHLYLEEGEKVLGEETLGKMEAFSSKIDNTALRTKMESSISRLRDQFFRLRDRQVRRNAFVSYCPSSDGFPKIKHVTALQKEGLTLQPEEIEEGILSSDLQIPWDSVL